MKRQRTHWNQTQTDSDMIGILEVSHTGIWYNYDKYAKGSSWGKWATCEDRQTM